MSKDYRLYIDHIREEVEYLLECQQGLTREALVEDGTLKRAVVRSLEIIGEATKKLPDEFRRQHDQIPWSQMAGMRDVLIHDYFGVDYDIVWDVLTKEIPTLRNQLIKIESEYDG
jgi:uncharacterized protein with HEPN domain